jgi:hypothetical protein
MKDIVIPINVERPEDFDQAVEKVKIRAVQLGISAKPRIRPKAGTVTYRVPPGSDEQLIGSSGNRVGGFGGHSGGKACGHWFFCAWSGVGIWHDEGWPNQASGSGGYRMGIRSPVFERKRPYAACSVIPMCGSSASIGAQKNGLRRLRPGPDGLVRPAGAVGSRPVERRVPGGSGARGAARRVPRLRHREARTAGLAGGQSALHQALCVLWVFRESSGWF